MSEMMIKLAWPALALLAGLVFFRPLHRAITALAKNIEQGAPVTAGGLSVGSPHPPDEKAVTEQLKEAAEPPPQSLSENQTMVAELVAEFSDDLLGDANIALFHTSFRRRDVDARLISGAVYQIEVIVLGPQAALDQIENVTYLMAPAYPKRRYDMGVDRRGDRFKLKELASGYSIVRAEIRFKSDQPPLRLNRFIDLRDGGPDWADLGGVPTERPEWRAAGR